MALVHSQHGYSTSSPTTFTPSVAPTAGNLLVLTAATRAGSDRLLAITGWTIVESATATVPPSSGAGLSMFYRVAQTGDTGWSIAASQCEMSYSEWSGHGALSDSASQIVDPGAAPYPVDCGGSVSATAGALVIGCISMSLQNDTDAFTGTPGAGVTELDDWATLPSVNGSPGRWTVYRIASTSGTTDVGGTGSVGGITFPFAGITAVFGGAPVTEPTVGAFDPSGVHIVSFDNLIDHRERIEYNGVGSGMLIINRHDPQATAANLARGNIVRVTYPEIDQAPVAEWIIETGDFELVSSDEQGGEVLTFSGRGSLALAEYSILGHEWLDHTHPKLNFPKEGVWRWTSEEWAGIVRRTLDEAELHQPPALTQIVRDGWSDTTDSDGNPFFDMDGTYEYRIGTDLLTAWMDLARAGNGQMEMRPGFLLRLYDDMGRDLSGGFGSGNVRFEDGYNITTEVSRQMAARRWASSALIHTKTGYLWYPWFSWVPLTGSASADTITSAYGHRLSVGDQVWFLSLTGGAGLTVGTLYYVETVVSGATFKVSATPGGAAVNFTTNITAGRMTSAPYIKEVELDLTSMDGTNAQERAAARNLTRGQEGLEGVIFEVSPIGFAGEENDEAGGWYYPGWDGTGHGKYWVGDIVTFHTGTGEMDFDEASLRVQAITLGVDATGQFAPPIVELSSPWGTGDVSAPSSEARPAPGGGGSGGGVAGPHVHTQYQLGPHISAVDPTVNDDEDDDYVIGARWLNTTDDQEWVALDVTAGAAVWVETSGGGGGGITVQDEGTPLTTTADTLNFTGAGVTASGTGATKTINITGGGGGGDPFDGKPYIWTPPTSPNSVDDEFNDGSGMSGPVNGLDAKWSKHNLGTSTWIKFDDAIAPGCLIFDIPTGQATDQVLYQTAPAGDFTIAARFIYAYTSDRQMWSVLIVDSAGTGVAIDADSGTTQNVRPVTAWTQSGSPNALLNPVNNNINPANDYPSDIPWTFSLRKASGVYWAVMHRSDRKIVSTYLNEVSITPSAFTVAYIGIGRIYGTGVSRVMVDHFRRTA